MTNKREFFRVVFFKDECDVFDFRRKQRGFIKNISGTGIALEVNVDDFQNEIMIEFELLEEKFLRKGEIIRRVRQVSGRVMYAIKFIDQTDKERERLYQKLIQIDALRLNQIK